MRGTRFSVLRRWQFRAAGSAWWTLAAAAFVAATVLAAAPGLLQRTADAQLRYELGQLSPNLRDMDALSYAAPPLGPPADPGSPAVPAPAASVWGALGDQLAALRGQIPQPLRQVLGPPRFTMLGNPLPIPPPPPGVPPGNYYLGLAVDPWLTDSATLTSGTWPIPPPGGATGAPWSMVLSAQSAARLGWRVGQVRRWAGTDSPLSVQLSGTFAAAPGSDGHWQLNRSVLQPDIEPGTNSDLISATAFVHPSTWAAIMSNGGYKGELRIAFALTPDAVPVDEAAQIGAQLDKFTSVTHQLTPPAGNDAGTLSSLRLTSRAPAALSGAAEKISASRSVLSVIAVGPDLAALTVVVMAAGALSRRRRPAHLLLTARGIPWGALRASTALEGLLVAALPAAAGVVVALLLLPPSSPAAAIGLAAIALAAVAMTVAAAPLPAGAAREDTGEGTRPRWRRVVQLAVLGATGVAIVVLYRGRPAAAGPLDPVVVLVPILLALAVSIVVRWLLPVPLRVLIAVLRRRRGLVGFLGAARAIRSPSAGFALALALLVAVSAAVFSASLLSTLNRGVSAAALSTVGADARVDALSIPAEKITAAAGQPGVDAVCPIDVQGGASVTVAGLDHTITVYLVDTATLARVQAGVPDAIGIPPGMDRTAGPIPVVVSAGFFASMQVPSTAALAAGGSPLRVVATAPAASGFSPAPDWMLADRSVAAAFGAQPTDATTLLLRLTPTADPAAAVARLPALFPDATISTAPQRAAALLASPSIRGATTAAIAALAVTLLLSVVAMIMSAIAGTAARSGVVIVLRALGLPRRAVSRLTAWEFLPPAVGALIGGTAAGLALLALIRHAVDLRPYTGGRTAPAVSIDLPQLGAVLGILVVVIAAATVGASFAARRRDVTLVDRLEPR